MGTILLWGGVLISAQVRQAQLEQRCCQTAFQEPCDGNRQQLHFVPYYIQIVEQHVLRNGHWLLEIRQTVLQLFGWYKQPKQPWLHMCLLPESGWMHSVPHATAFLQGTYVIYSSNGIQWNWWMYHLRGEIKRLVVKCTGTLVEFCHSYDDCDRFNSYGSRVELWLSLYLGVQTRHIIQTIWVTGWNG